MLQLHCIQWQDVLQAIQFLLCFYHGGWLSRGPSEKPLQITALCVTMTKRWPNPRNSCQWPLYRVIDCKAGRWYYSIMEICLSIWRRRVQPGERGWAHLGSFSCTDILSVQREVEGWCPGGGGWWQGKGGTCSHLGSSSCTDILSVEREMNSNISFWGKTHNVPEEN